MNAKRMRTIWVSICAAVLPASFTGWASAAPNDTNSTARAQSSAYAASPAERLTRDDVQQLLKLAQEAIQRGNLDQAEALVARAENARVRYPLFHVGPTPSSVRRELTKAERTAPRAGNAAALAPAGGQPLLGESGSSLPLLPSKQPLVNPFAPAEDSMVRTAQYEEEFDSRYREAPGLPSLPRNDNSVADGPRLMGGPAQTSVESFDSFDEDFSDDETWALPGAPLPPGAQPDAAVPASNHLAAKQQALQHLTEARQALDAGNLGQAEELARQASALNVPESQFLPQEDRPSLLAWEIMQARSRAAARPSAPRESQPAAATSISPAAADASQAPEPRLAFVPEPLDLPTASVASRDAPDPPRSLADSPYNMEPLPSLIETTQSDQQALARQLSSEVGKRQSEARRLREKNPQQALAMLRETREEIAKSTLSDEFRNQLLRRIDITIDETQQYFDANRAEIELDQSNQAVLEEVDRRREVKLKVQEKMAELVDEFNRLRDEQRYAEMEIVARRLIEMAPDDPVAQQIWQTAKFIRREYMNRELADRREDANWNAWNDVENSAVQTVGDEREMIYDQKRWDLLVKNRKGSHDRMQRRTERELEIERRLRTPVMLKYEETPLSQVIDSLSQLAGVNIHLDPRGLSQEGIHSNTPVTVNINTEISLKSALNLILEPLHLSYVIKDEVLKITSEQLRNGEIYPVIYNVADLVIPIPNFVPSNNIGLQGLIHDAHVAMGGNNGVLGAPGPTVMVDDRRSRRGAAGNDNVLAQQFNQAPNPGFGSTTVPIGSGPGGMGGGGANADFDSLIDLIVSTVATETWAENGGGEAEIRPFPTNLSLVISQTQAVHEEIAELLAQLRRLQDLQVTIEVRFIQLSDNFFERIGVDFQMNIEDRTVGNADLLAGAAFEPGRRSSIVGLSGPAVEGFPALPTFSSDLDIPFRQNSFALTRLVPGSPADVATFGFAILSDIEAYFLIEAAQGDRRANILQAPKVTLFNGQIAFVADAVQMPFVIGVIPVVGEFVAAQQPVIVVLNEGTMMTIQAVVSDDRRYVRMTIVPYFTEVGEVQEFTFEGSTSTSASNSSSNEGGDDDPREQSESEQVVRSGVTVQLPSFQFVSVVTTVSVPDGGTVLLGGIKRLREGRSEIGVPLLSKVPYINRLFKNVGIGRETDSLMMMVTPRIIIQEEEEERLGVSVP